MFSSALNTERELLSEREDIDILNRSALDSNGKDTSSLRRSHIHQRSNAGNRNHLLHVAGREKFRGGGLFETKDGMARKCLELRYGTPLREHEQDQAEKEAQK